MTELAEQFETALMSLDRLTVNNILTQTMDKYDWTPIQFVENVIVPAMVRIGIGWEAGSVALSQNYMSGRICEELVNTILPSDAPDRKHQPRMAITVLEDYHLLGKRIVYSLLRASGFELSDYGQATTDDLVRRVREDKIEVLLISVLMLPSALKVRDVRTKLDETGTDIKIVVGGAPFLFDDLLWEEVGADAMGKKASEAAEIITNIMGGVS